MSVRDQLTRAMKEAMKEKNNIRLSTIRLINAAVKDKDINARTGGTGSGIPDAEIHALLHTMIKQRLESIKMYESGNRPDLVEQEESEIAVIREFLPPQMEGTELESTIKSLLTELGASTVKDMGRVMAALKEKYAGQMDMAAASAMVKQKLGS